MEGKEYQILGDIDHVLVRPDMYVGAVESHPREGLLYNLETKKMMKATTIQHSEALERIFLEILANAADNVQRSRDRNIPPKNIEVTVGKDYVRVKNYGCGIPVVKHDAGVYVPTAIFGMMRSSSNYDDSKKRLLIGRNGYGAKLTNIFSLDFRISVGDSEHALLFEQVWKGNMKKVGKPRIREYSGESFTQVTYYPDFSRFKISEFDEEALSLYAAHCVIVSFTCDIPVILNGQRIIVKDIAEFANLFFKGNGVKKISLKEETYSLCLADTPDDAVICSFVNGAQTPMHGVHVDAVYSAILAALPGILKGLMEGVKLTKTDLTRHVSIFIACRLPNPSFKSQTKEYLTKPKPHITLPPALLKKIAEWDMIETICMNIRAKQERQLKKTDGKKNKRFLDEKNLSDANFAATKRAHECTLMLVEGVSATGYPGKYISVIPGKRGRDFFGILPMGGKPLNVLNAKFITLVNNTVFNRVKRTLGLREGANYLNDRDYRTLRYGRVWLMEDADNDGKHIAGLILLFFMQRFRSLIERGVLYMYRTPILRLSKKRGKGNLKFYSLPAYEAWARDHTPTEWHHEYFKGLATSSLENAKEDYAEPNIVQLICDEKATERLILAFDRRQPLARKEWLAGFYDRAMECIDEKKELNISEFIDGEYIYYPLESNQRSLPCLDGFKEGQRKAFFGACRYFSTKEGKSKKKVKIIQIASISSGLTDYKHGEQCLAQTITAMAQDFIGANNEPLFHSKCSIGSREKGGKNAGDPRYTFAHLPPYLKYLFPPEDKCIMRQRANEGNLIEYESYYPVMPLILINAQAGIGVAYSTNFPSFYPPILGEWIKTRLRWQKEVNEKKDVSQEILESKYPFPELVPWYAGFKGLYRRRKNGFSTEGVYETDAKGNIHITELPVGSWSENYVSFLNKLVEDGTIQDREVHNTEWEIDITVEGWNREKLPLNKRNLRLIRRFSYNNLTVNLEEGKGILLPHTFHNPITLLEKFVDWRLEKYYMRRDTLIAQYESQIPLLENRYRFILAVMDGKLVVYRRKRSELLPEMKAMNFDEKLLDEVKTRHYTYEELQKIEKDIADLRERIALLRKTPPEDVWTQEINAYLADFMKRHAGEPAPVFEKDADMDEEALPEEVEAVEANEEVEEE